MCGALLSIGRCERDILVMHFEFIHLFIKFVICRFVLYGCSNLGRSCSILILYMRLHICVADPRAEMMTHLQVAKHDRAAKLIWGSFSRSMV